MLYTVLLYTMLYNDDTPLAIVEIQKHPIFSNVPIIECYSRNYINEVTAETRTVYNCKTERLYYNMTGNDNHKVVVDGVYDA